MLSQARVLTLATVHAPESVALASTNGVSEPVPRDRLEIARAEWLKNRTVESLGRLDRISLRTREGLVSHLVQLGLFWRDAMRAAAGDVAGPPALRELRLRRVQEHVQMMRRTMTEAVQTAALDEFELSAQVHLGQASEEPGRTTTLEIPEPTGTVHIAHLGASHAFLGASRGGTHPAMVTWSPIRPPGPWERAGTWTLVLTALAVPLLVLAALRAEGSGLLGGAILVATLAALALAGGPLPLGAGLAMTAVGWLTRPIDTSRSSA
jgi:hypothetical protein